MELRRSFSVVLCLSLMEPHGDAYLLTYLLNVEAGGCRSWSSSVSKCQCFGLDRAETGSKCRKKCALLVSLKTSRTAAS